MKRVPLGIEDFKRMIDSDGYYVDKSNFIKNVLDEELVFFVRPRRFGKTLNLSMLYYFFSNKEKSNNYLFNGLNISRNQEAMIHQNQYPVIFLTFKDMKVSTFSSSLNKFKSLISRQIARYPELLNYRSSDSKIFEVIEKLYNETATDDEYTYSLLYLSEALEIVFHQKTLILIDEYDVPLQAAYQYGFYEEMFNFMRLVLSNGLKTNPSVFKGVLTGCLKIAKESIFTGLNNFNVYSILDYKNCDCFGFTTKEVEQMLSDYQMNHHMDEVREWYDGYLFGNKEIYNPWSTLKYIHLKQQDDCLEPVSFWANTSGNDIVYTYIQNSNSTMKDEFEQLINGKSIVKRIKPELTYREMDDINNIYSFLLFTGYLKVTERLGNDYFRLIIPNKEVFKIFQNSFMDYFEKYSDDRKNDLYKALENGDVERANQLLNDILENSISYYDNYESFYHGFLVGLFSGYTVESNKEAGVGRFDLAILPRRITQTAIVFECKHSISDANLVEDAKKAANQMIENRYLSHMNIKKYLNSVGYGISFNKKQCYIVKVMDVNK